jgi:excisionase family DNA binding protein
MTLHPPRERTFYTPDEVASMMRLSRDTITRYARTGKLEAQRTPGGQWRIPVAAVQHLFQQFESQEH